MEIAITLLGMMALLLVLLLPGVVMIVGAVKMMRLRSYSWAISAGVLALLPCTPAGLLGLVTGIWTLIVLNRPEVKAAFAAQANRAVVAPKPRSWIGRLVALAILLLLLLVLVVPLCVWLAWRVEGRGATQGAFHRAQTTRKPADLPSQPSVVLHVEGPMVDESFARDRLRLRPTQINQINLALQDAFRAYRALEEEHTSRRTTVDGHVVTTIKPFADQGGELTKHLWSQLDAILTDPQQQTVARTSLDLGLSEGLPPDALKVGGNPPNVNDPCCLGWTQRGSEIDIWRVGAWFHWMVAAENRSTSSKGPELPNGIRRFWQEPAGREPLDKNPKPIR